MIWSKIKKAINSTLGTSGFKPLDKIITDSFQAVVGKQNEMKTALESGENNFIVEFAKSSANIEVGSYIGTGTYGEKNPNGLTFSFEPKFVHIIGTSTNGVVGSNEISFVCDSEVAYYASYYRSISADLYYVPSWKVINVSWDANTIQWYNGEKIYSDTVIERVTDAQMNANGVTYRYIAIG